MYFSPEQDAALMAVDTWYKSGTQQVFHLFGYAGTGKTTLAKHIAEHIDGLVLFAAYTGKAAHVLRSKGCPNASTIHSLIYYSREKSKNFLITLHDQLATLHQELRDAGMTEPDIQNHKRVKELLHLIQDEENNSKQPYFVLNQESDVANADLVIIDECSMVDAKMGADLLSFGTPILVLGDPAQLPPVGGAGYFTEGITPNVMLTEIHRQAEESPILRLATMARNQQPLMIGEYGDGVSVLPVGTRLDHDRVLAFNQILVGKNKTRTGTNNKIRSLKGIEDPYPIIGDRLVCLRNNSELGLLNGAIFTVTDIEGVMDRKVFMSIQPEDSIASIPVSSHEHHFLGEGDSINFYQRGEAQEFDYGYALTVHKSQGSQWDDVCLFDEAYCFRNERWRWLYTGITRAATKLIIVKM